MKQFIKDCIDRGLSMEVVERMHHQGRVPCRHFEGYCRVWEWTAGRMGGSPGMRHDAFWERFGKRAYYRKIEKTRAAFGLSALEYPKGFWEFGTKENKQ